MPNEIILDFEQALALLADQPHPAPRPPEQVPLLASANRVLAEPILADRDQPPFNRSTRDGFAVQAAELTTGPLAVAGKIRAGEAWPDSLPQGQALQMMTGAPVPAGADAVVMIEHTHFAAGTIHLLEARTLAAGDNIVPRGSEARAGTTVVPAGTRIGAAEIALAASAGYVDMHVHTRPSVAIVATGDELVELAQTPGAHQIRNSNTYALAALVSAAGGHAVPLPIAPDAREALHPRIETGRSHDLLIFSGGVSMGDYDLVEDVLTAAGAEYLFTGVRLQPGRPVVFGYLPATDTKPFPTPFFGLPGNPISTQVTFHAFVEPFLRALAQESAPTPRWAQATLSHAAEARPNLTRLLPARLTGTQVAVTPWQGSGDLAANARANCYAELLPARTYAPGEVIRILLR